MTREQIYIQGNLLWFLSLIIALVLQVLVGHWLWLTCNAAVEQVSARPLFNLNLTEALIAPEPEPKPAAEPQSEDIASHEATFEKAPEKILEHETKPLPEPQPEPVIEKVVEKTEPVPEEKPQEIQKPFVKKPLPRPRVVKKTEKKPEIKPQVKKVQAATVVNAKENELSPNVSTITKKADTKAVVATMKPGTPAKPDISASPVQQTRPTPVNMNRFSAYLRNVFRVIERNRRYPSNARRRRIEGSVDVSFRILADGKVADAVASDASHSILREAALKILQTVRLPAPPKDWDTGARIGMKIRYSLR